ncbi:MAG: hypothetical protein IID31_07195 [Planctomycetes bacterium]|nr:hypothetical protein [Planctomycetota bacterium]
MNRWMIGLLALWPGLALGQVGFFDHFEGNALLPHWNQPPPSRHWEYNVSNSMLNVTHLLWPSHPKSSSNSAGIWADFPPVGGDFQAVGRMGRGPSQPGYIEMFLNGPAGGTEFIAGFGFSGSFLVAQTARTTMLFPPPPAGMYDFTILRSGGDIHFLLDGQLVVTLPAVVGAPAARITLIFLEPFPRPGPGAFHVDLIQVVPPPASLVVLVLSGLGLLRRRRR